MCILLLIMDYKLVKSFNSNSGGLELPWVKGKAHILDFDLPDVYFLFLDDAVLHCCFCAFFDVKKFSPTFYFCLHTGNRV